MPQAFRESDDQAFCYLNHCFVKMTSIKQKNIHLDNHIDQLHVNYKVNIITPFYVKMPEAKTVHVTESTYCICIFREFFIFREKWVHFSRFSRKISNTKNVQHYWQRTRSHRPSRTTKSSAEVTEKTLGKEEEEASSYTRTKTSRQPPSSQK